MGWQDDPVASGASTGWQGDPVVKPPAAGASTEEQPSFLHELGRTAGMQTGEFVKGVASLLSLPTDTIVRLINLGAGHRVMVPAAETISGAIDQITPQPRNATERVTNAIVGGLGGAATGIGLGGAIGGVAGGIMAANPGQQLASAIGGSGASALTREAGGGPVAQTVAGIAGSLAPSVGAAALSEGARRLVRGGESGRQQMEDNIQAFQDAGTTPTVGQATEGRTAQAAESLLSRTPGAAGRMTATAQNQADEIGSNLSKLAEELSPQSSGEQAGRAISRGISGNDGFIGQFKTQAKTLYDKLDQYVKPSTKFAVPKTIQVLDDLTQQIYGAENTSKFFINSKISAIKNALQADLQSAGSINALPYEAIKKLRSLVGEQLADAPFAGDVPVSQWKKLYGALSSDLEMNASAVSPQAEAALSRANKFYAAGSKRLDVLSSVIDKNGGPEAVFRAATSGTKEGATTLRAVMQSLPPDAQKAVTATVLSRLGRARAGVQDASGDLFSTETFLTNWSTMSPQAKVALFDRYGPDFRQNMDQIAKVAANLRSGSSVFRNPSGTGQAVAQTTAAATFLTSLLTGHVGAAAGVAAGVGGANLSAKLLTNPNAVKWLATATRAPVSAVSALLNRAAQSGDPDLRSLASMLKENQVDEKGQ